jgi:hypothetical protein
MTRPLYFPIEYWYTCGFLYNAAGVSDCCADGKIVSEGRIGKDWVGSGHNLIEKKYLCLPTGSRGNHETPYEKLWPGQTKNPQLNHESHVGYYHLNVKFAIFF